VQALRQLDRIDVVVSNFASPPPSIAAHPPLWLLVAISSCGPFALNLFVPSLPRLAETFETDYGTAQLALTLFLVGIAVGQPIYGPLSDCYGRRPVLLGGLGIGLAGSLLCLTAPTIDILLAGRFLQAFGCCVGGERTCLCDDGHVADAHDRPVDRRVARREFWLAREFCGAAGVRVRGGARGRLERKRDEQ
jgi:hypothetical protein